MVAILIEMRLKVAEEVDTGSGLAQTFRSEWAETIFCASTHKKNCDAYFCISNNLITLYFKHFIMTILY